MQRGEGVHTTPAVSGRGWVNQSGGCVLSRHRLKRVAVVAGRAAARARQVEHTIHRTDGRIAEKNSYGNDPHPPRDGR
jgi:Uncharacterized protein conserved in bacteria (DUF2188)